jgi:hypothetical protein
MVKVGVLNLQLNIDLNVNMLYATMQMYNTLMQPNLCTNPRTHPEPTQYVHRKTQIL